MSIATMTSLPVIPNTSQRSVEGLARVVRVTADQLWLEPEQTTSCGHCASSASCGIDTREAAGIGTVTSRLQERRFIVGKPGGMGEFRDGDRLVVGVSEGSLLGAALTAYGIPLAFALTAGSITQGIYCEDLTTMGGMAAGLLLGLLVARVNALRLAARGDLAPRILRRARADETCGTV
jgi:sigma-E factor negative regulatory protein RseC